MPAVDQVVSRGGRPAASGRIAFGDDPAGHPADGEVSDVPLLEPLPADPVDELAVRVVVRCGGGSSVVADGAMGLDTAGHTPYVASPISVQMNKRRPNRVNYRNHKMLWF